MISRARIAPLLVPLLWMGASGARADEPNPSLVEARALLEGLEYDRAGGALDVALRQGSSGPRDLGEIYRLRGQVEAVLGHDAGAREAFRRMLALDPEARLPPGASSKIRRPFEAAAADLKRRGPLRVHHELSARPRTAVTLVVDSDPLGMVAGARVTYRSGRDPWQTAERRGKRRIEVAIRGPKRIEIRVAALDEHGNRLVELGTADVPIVYEVPAPAPPRSAASSSGVARPPPSTSPSADRPARPSRAWLWTAVAASAAAGAGITIGFKARADADEVRDLMAGVYEHSYAEVRSAEETARRSVLLTNVAFGTAGALALTSGILWLFWGRGGEEAPARVTVTPAGDGVVVGVGLRLR